MGSAVHSWSRSSSLAKTTAGGGTRRRFHFSRARRGGLGERLDVNGRPTYADEINRLSEPQRQSPKELAAVLRELMRTILLANRYRYEIQQGLHQAKSAEAAERWALARVTVTGSELASKARWCALARAAELFSEVCDAAVNGGEFTVEQMTPALGEEKSQALSMALDAARLIRRLSEIQKRGNRPGEGI